MSPQYGELRPTSGWDRSGSLRSVAQQKPTKLCTVFGCLLCWYTTYTFSGALAPLRILPGTKLNLHAPSLALSYFGSVTARHLSSGHEPNFAALSTRRHLYLAGWPSRWALAHILVNLGHIRPVIEHKIFIYYAQNIMTKFGKNLARTAQVRHSLMLPVVLITCSSRQVPPQPS